MSSPHIPAHAVVDKLASTPVLSGITITGPSIPSAWGSLVVPQAIFDKWQALEAQSTADGQPVQEYLGFALQVLPFSGGHGTAVYFERGMIVLRPDGQVFAVYGMIYLRYRASGDVVPPGWSPGLPVSDEEAVPNGRRSRFDGADIYWSPATDAHEVHGAIRDHYAVMGGCGSWLGFPTTDESSVHSGGNEIGRVNDFQGASIYWSAASGAFEVHGALRAAWLERFGGPAGPLGFPVGDETGSPAGTYRYNDFQNGCLTWRVADGFVQSFTAVDVYVDRFSSQGTHTVGEEFGASIWLFVNSTVTASTGQSASPSFPGGGNNYGNPNASPQSSIITLAPVRGAMVINASFTGFDHSPVQGDQNLGTVSGQFAIDQLWGIDQPQEHWDSSNSFFVAYSVRNQTAADPNDPHYRQDLFWSFGNFDTTTLSRQQYAQTFVDVEVGESAFFHPFDELFYDLVYKGVAAGGNCFGMCLEANDTLARMSVYSEPLGQVGMDATAVNEINVKHGYQLGVNVVNYVVGKFLTGGTHDPVRAFNESRDMYNAGDYPILSLTNAYIGGDGHAVRPYAWDQSNPSDWVIHIANPNLPAGRGGDDDPQNVIHIDPNANTFSFQFAPGNTWSGGAWTGGRMFALPFSIMCSEQNTPFWDVVLALLGAAFIILGGDGSTLQISDDHNRTFYSPTLTGPPTLWSDVAADGPARIPGMVRLPIVASGQLPRVAAATISTVQAVLSPAASVPAPTASRLAGRTIDPSILGNLLVQSSAPEVYQVPIDHPFGVWHPPGLAGRQAAATLSSAAHLSATAIGQAAAPTSAAAPPATHAGAVGAQSESLTTTAIRQTAPAAALTALTPQPLPGSAGTITHAIAGNGSGTYQWGMRSPAVSVVASVPTASGLTDHIAVQRPGALDQSVTVTMAAGGTARAAALNLAATTLDGASAPNVFTLSNLSIEPGQAFTAQLSPDGQELVVQNPGPAVTFQLDVRKGGPTGLVASRPSVAVAAGQVASIQPTNWTPAPGAPTQAPVTMRILESVGGAVIREVSL